MEIRTPIRMVKSDCFAYDNYHRECKALTNTYCMKEECSFYKTKEENLKQKEEAENRAENKEYYKNQI